MTLTSIELCAGGGGQAVGLERAGFEHLALVENDAHACATLRANRPRWDVIEGDLREFDATEYSAVDLVAAGVPCPPFSHAGKQLGADDDRDLFPEAIRVIGECEPRAVMLENVRGLLDPRFADYRAWIETELAELGYVGEWRLLHAADFGVPQLRPRVIFVGFRDVVGARDEFAWPEPAREDAPTVGEALGKLMGAGGWRGAKAWARTARAIGPTIVGGSKKHGGPDLGPTRAKQAWAVLGVDGKGVADAPPGPGFEGMPKLTIPMVARLQGFPDDWTFVGRKTHAYRQVGNAFPPPVAEAVGRQIAEVLATADSLLNSATKQATALGTRR